MDRTEIWRKRAGRPAESYTSGLGRRDSLGLTPADVFTFILGHEGQNLENQVGNEGSHQVFTVSSIQKRHIQHTNIDTDFLRENTPLFLYFLIITSQSVNA